MEEMKIDGRKMRWFDCDWNNKTGIPNGCEKCKVCKYLNFLDWANSVAPSGSTIEYNDGIEKYLKTKSRKLTNPSE
jgi:hypothetical protein